MTIYTIGTSNREYGEFIDILNAYEVELLVDVRSFPRSRRYSWFNKEHLARALIEHKIEYVFLGEELGGFRKGDFEAYTLTEGFRKGLDKIEQITSNKKAVIMCAEKLPDKCHRRFIAESLEERGFKVIHIIEKNEAWRSRRQITIFNK